MDIQIKQDNFDLVKSMNKTALKPGLEMCAGTAENYAKELCPVDTGRLRQSIGHICFERPATGDIEAEVGTNVEYAEFVELGTRYQHAQPYLKPALAEHAAEYSKIFQQVFKKFNSKLSDAAVLPYRSTIR